MLKRNVSFILSIIFIIIILFLLVILRVNSFDNDELISMQENETQLKINELFNGDYEVYIEDSETPNVLIKYNTINTFDLYYLAFDMKCLAEKVAEVLTNNKIKFDNLYVLIRKRDIRKNWV